MPYSLRTPRTCRAAPPSISPMPAPTHKHKQQRKRAPRKSINLHLPPDVKMDPQEIRRMKNRVAAARLRERSQQYIDELQAQIEHYKRRCEVLEAVVAVCTGCANVCEQQAMEIDLLPATPKIKIKKEVTAASREDDDMSDDDSSMLLGEAECAALDELLHPPVHIAVEHCV